MPANPTLLIVEDDEAIRSQMKWAFASDYEVRLAEDRGRALEIVASDEPSVVTLDLGLPPHPHDPSEGLRALAEILDADPSCKVIVITGQDDRQNALRAIELGAYDFLAKPIRIDELKIVIQRALYIRRLEQENLELRHQTVDDSFEGMIGSSPRMLEVFEVIRNVAATEASVLVTGETGTGKELVARAIHRLSPRESGPFIAINCGAIPKSLLEAELFGHEKGAFTDAHMQRKGRIELADGGTLFLDEIGELPADLQVTLLRYLEERKLQRIGGRKDIAVDARVVAATNVDLTKAIRDGEFREDLYYRLAVVNVFLPPLRDRGGDLLLLADVFLRRHVGSSRKKVTGFTNGAMKAMRSHPWSGNVRELENRIKRALLMTKSRQLTPTDLELATVADRREGKGLKEARAELERDMIQAAIGRHRGNLTQVAAELGISRPTLYELMDRLGIARS